MEILPCRDMPPPGGYETLKYKRNLPLKGPSGAVLFGGVFAICIAGFYRLGQGNVEKRCVHVFVAVTRKKKNG